MDVNITPLKNQLTDEGKQSQNNPYAGTSIETETDNRLYHSIDTGTHQEGGLDSIHINYRSNTKSSTYRSSILQSMTVG